MSSDSRTLALVATGRCRGAERWPEQCRWTRCRRRTDAENASADVLGTERQRAECRFSSARRCAIGSADSPGRTFRRLRPPTAPTETSIAPARKMREEDLEIAVKVRVLQLRLLEKYGTYGSGRFEL